MQLSAFVPKERDFSNDYQFKMHQSWLEKGGFKANIPANFSETSISKTFTNAENKKISVIYLWEKWKIYEQRENLSAFCDFSKDEVAEKLLYLETFIYRLNCENPQFVRDIFDKKNMSILYSDEENINAFDVLINSFQKKRFEVAMIKLSFRNNRLGFIVSNSENDSFELYFPESLDTVSMLKEIRLLEEIRAQELNKLKVQEIERLKELETIKQKVAEWQQEMETEEEIVHFPLDKTKGIQLATYIQRNYQKRQSRELLHNKIDNSETFIRNEFEQREIQKNGNKYFIRQTPFLSQFRNDMRIEVKNTNDGIDILPLSDYQINGKKIMLGYDESLDLTKLSEQEIQNIAPYLCQLLYGHRAMGTRLLNFLLIHDDVPTSLVLYGAERELFEMYSYANMILLLHNYWQDRTVYFILDDFKKVNDYIEFTGFIAARSQQTDTYDFAEIRYQLNHDYRIQIAMMILHPDIEIEKNR
jgi:hypothetical protein